jgi:hypothetical protein
MTKRQKYRQHNGQKTEVQTTQWPKGKKYKQRSTKHTHKTRDRVTGMPLKSGGELRCSGRVGSSSTTSGTRRVNLVTNPVITHEGGKDREVFTTSGAYPWSFVFSGVRVIRFLDLCVRFVFRCMFFCTFSLCHCVVCSSQIYRFWLPIWYLQTLLITALYATNWYVFQKFGSR